jgi:hypothetical protein
MEEYVSADSGQVGLRVSHAWAASPQMICWSVEVKRGFQKPVLCRSGSISDPRLTDE